MTEHRRRGPAPGRAVVEGNIVERFLKISSPRIHRRPAAAAAAAIALLLSPAPRAAGVDFLVPGVSLESVGFEAGSSVLYMVISRTADVADTTTVGISVLDDSRGVFLVEIMSSTWPPRDEETVTARLHIDGRIVSATSVDEVRDRIIGISIRDGLEPFREPSEEEIDDFGMERLFPPVDSSAVKKDLGVEKISTPAGLFESSVVEYVKSSSRPVDLGGVKAERTEEERSTLMLSPRVPLWGLVRSRVERTAHTRLESSKSKIRPVSRVTVTEAVLVDFRRD